MEQRISSMNAQAEAFACFLNLCAQLDETDLLIDRDAYFNGRERGFVVTVFDRNRHVHFAWFEHRNSDELCVIEWTGERHPKNRQCFLSSDIPSEAYPDKWSVTKSFGFGNFGEAWGWLHDRITEFKREAIAA